ncbi:hypothetical protein ILUMI_09981 [Ignelater luminosus]|uniref:Uncharacterized protein n=1 Tax=Ignelater luminosus TaxID=2038154 RepID=A0A8K0CYS0_IGNLU|nr:hypothetical protein ILUMI_09981 [Ignelater luminosus]
MVLEKPANVFMFTDANYIASRRESGKFCSFWSKPQQENQEDSSDNPPANLTDSSSSLISLLGELQSSSLKAVSSHREPQPIILQGACHAVASCVITGILYKDVQVADQIAKQDEEQNRNYVKKRLNFEGEETNKQKKVNVEKTKKKDSEKTERRQFFLKNPVLKKSLLMII